jgi:hypothetical protein
MKINCLSCGHNVDLDQAYAENYEGAVKCCGCDAMLSIKTEQGDVRSVHLCAPREHPERVIDRDSSDDHRGTPQHNGARHAHADKIQ